MTTTVTSEVTDRTVPTRGGTESAIRHHYDASNTFYRLWLDESMTYSCALWDDHDSSADLATAQRKKIAYHLDCAGIGRARHVLDIGCGWGAVLAQALSQKQMETATGLTLSEAQLQHLVARNLPNLDVRKESWVDHKPSVSYDSIISIGAFEHFASPGNTSDEKVDLYREFFEKCRSWLSPTGRMSLQTIAYGTMRAEEASEFINLHIFPDSELPQPHEILQAASGIFEVTLLRNDRIHYGRTCDIWYRNLRRQRDIAVKLVGTEKVSQYEKYLRMSSFGFYSGKICLLRLALTPIFTEAQQRRTAAGRATVK
jgi:cyclopropane-fatty-acyl-phospholipid synthase